MHVQIHHGTQPVHRTFEGSAGTIRSFAMISMPTTPFGQAIKIHLVAGHDVLLLDDLVVTNDGDAVLSFRSKNKRFRSYNHTQQHDITLAHRTQVLEKRSYTNSSQALYDAPTTPKRRRPQRVAFWSEFRSCMVPSTLSTVTDSIMSALQQATRPLTLPISKPVPNP